MCSIANYDVTAACGYVGWPLNGFASTLWEKTIPWWMHKFMENTMSKGSTLYAFAFKSYNG